MNSRNRALTEAQLPRSSDSPAAGSTPHLQGPFTIREQVDATNTAMNQSRTTYTVIDRFLVPVHQTGHEAQAQSLAAHLNAWHDERLSQRDFHTADIRAREGQAGLSTLMKGTRA